MRIFEKKLFRDGFTLAEVLVTLGIVGIISALTVPALVRDNQRRVFATSLHKNYNELSQAIEKRMSDRNAVDLREAGVSNNSGLITFIQRTYKSAIPLNRNSLPSYTNINGQTFTVTIPNGARCFQLDSSAILCGLAASVFQNEDGDDISAPTMSGYFILDTNGKEGPNTLGRDLFTIAFNNSGKLFAQIPYTPGFTEAFNESDMVDICKAATNHTTQFDSFACLRAIQNESWRMTY